MSEEEDDDFVYRPHIVHTNNRNYLEKLENFNKLELEHFEAEELTKDLEERTRRLEAVANEALDPYQNTPKDEKPKESKIDSSIEDGYVEEAFNELDLDKDGILDVREIKNERIFDLNKNNFVEDREMKWFYDAMPGIANLELFRKKMWKKMGRLYVLEKEMDKSFKFQFEWGNEKDESGTDEDRKNQEKKRKAEEQEREEQKQQEIDDLEDEFEDEKEENINYTEKVMDDNTKRTVLEAIQIRKQLVEAKQKLENVKMQKDWAERTLNDHDVDEGEVGSGISEHLDDFGPNERSKYFPLRMHCFKYTGKRHLYRLCPFWGVTQTERYRKGDGVDLGRWVGWSREKGEPVMVFKFGSECDNGQKRSTKVKIYCGSTNLLVYVEEPKPCEYRMEFKSPAGCHIKHLKDANVTITSHDEL